MSPSTTQSHACPSCGAASATMSNFCSECGEALIAAPCDECGTPLPRTARFCNECGKPSSLAVRSSAGRRRRPLTRPALQTFGIVTMIALSAAILFIALGIGRRSASAEPNSRFVATQQGIVPAPDISSMSARERATRLYARVTRLNKERKGDSVDFFVPMAIAAFTAIPDLDAEGRNELARIETIARDRARAVHAYEAQARENADAVERLRATRTR